MLCNEPRLSALMDQFALDGIIASTPENILYLSGFSSWSQNAYLYGASQVFVVHPRDPSQSPALLIPGGDVGYASLRDIWIKEIGIHGRPRKPKVSEGVDLSPEEKRYVSLLDGDSKGHNPLEALVQVVREKGLEHSKVGIDQFGLPLGTLEKLNSLLPKAQFLPASTFFRYVRMIKTGAEIERLRNTAILNQRAANALLKSARPGVSEGDLAGVYRAEVARAGGGVAWLHLAAGRGGNFPPLRDRILKKGDVLRMDMGCHVQGYHADTCRAGCIGDPNEKHRKVYEAVQTGVLKAVELLRPGALPSKLFETMIEGVRKAGIPNYSNFFVGHTLGLEAREFPYTLGPVQELKEPFLPNTTDVPMEAGMVVNVEASQHELGWGTVSVEYSLVVTEKGYEHLIPPDQRLHSLPLETMP